MYQKGCYNRTIKSIGKIKNLEVIKDVDKTRILEKVERVLSII